jgi:Flagellar motor protein
MFKKKKKNEEEGTPENSERWLLTYSDMITLLLALFIILYSMSTLDAKKFAQIAQSMGAALNNGPTTSAVSGTATGVAGAGKGTGTSGVGKGSGVTGIQVDALDQIYSILQTYVDQNHLQDQIGLVNTNTYVQIHLKDNLMFIPDSPNMLPESEPVLKEVEGAIGQVYDRVDHITFSGHTADVGPHTTAGDQVSWRLSTDRAVTVLNKMIGYGLPEDKLSIEGYAHFDPVANNNTEDGRAKNRRVEITIYKTPATAPSAAAGTASSSPAAGTSSAAAAQTSSAPASPSSGPQSSASSK